MKAAASADWFAPYSGRAVRPAKSTTLRTGFCSPVSTRLSMITRKNPSSSPRTSAPSRRPMPPYTRPAPRTARARGPGCRTGREPHSRAVVYRARAAATRATAVTFATSMGSRG
ncbi:hypothetical protein [Streptomyces somaliensis]|uniref:hypothetical protein n=1 Tax=Streptomyces somaliensis TaxID=78355 RepID=UPI0034E95ACB|nr:hypothetical protein [Streptomyces somaliensis]